MTNGEKFKDVFGFGADGSRVIAVNSTWWDCDFQIRKPKTNADSLRAKTDEEMALFQSVKSYSNGCPPPYKNCDCKYELKDDEDACFKCWLDWLKHEVE